MSSDGPVLDASAVLAYFRRETGHEAVRDALLTGATMSTVNLAEVHGRVALTGVDPDAALARLKVSGLAVEPFLEVDAAATGGLLASTRALGLSLADRACIALAQRLDRPVLTADRGWRSASVGVEIQLIR